MAALPTQLTGDVITQVIWNDLINFVNALRTDADTAVAGVAKRAFATDDTQALTPASTAETVLRTYTVAANTLNANGATLRFEFRGTLAANANGKTLRLKWGGASGTVIVASNTMRHAAQIAWRISGTITRLGSNSQRLVGELVIFDDGISGVNYFIQTLGTDTRTDSASNDLTVTGQNAVAAAGDITYEWSYFETVKP